MREEAVFRADHLAWCPSNSWPVMASMTMVAGGLESGSGGKVGLAGSGLEAETQSLLRDGGSGRLTKATET